LRIEWNMKHSTKKMGILCKIQSFLEYLEKNNKPSKNAVILDHKILFSLHDDLYNKIEKKEGWTNVIIINDIDLHCRATGDSPTTHPL